MYGIQSTHKANICCRTESDTKGVDAGAGSWHRTVYGHGRTVYGAYPSISVPYLYRIKPSSTLCRYGYRPYTAVYSIPYI